MKNNKIKIGEIVKVIPEGWRKTTSFNRKIRAISQSGFLVSRMKGKKYADTTSVYYGREEVMRNKKI